MKIAACLLFSAALILFGLAWWTWLHPSTGGGWINLHTLDVVIYLWPGIACAMLGLLLLWLSRYAGTHSLIMVIAKWAGIAIGLTAALAAIWALFESFNWSSVERASETRVDQIQKR